jgi:hypothetical protein
VFLRNGKQWPQQAYLKSDAPQPNDFFGSSVAVWGDTLVVGVPRASWFGNTPATRSGEVHVFVCEGGRVHYEMKKKWRDGTHALVFDVLSFIGRLIALIPPPRFHMLRFHGVLAPHASLRGQVVPGKTAATQPQPAQLSLPHLSPVEALSSSGTPDDNAPKPPSRHPWACLLKHVFAVDVTVCVKCGGPMRLSAFATTPAAIARALARAGLGAQPPPCSPQTRVHEAQLRLAFG